MEDSFDEFGIDFQSMFATNNNINNNNNTCKSNPEINFAPSETLHKFKLSVFPPGHFGPGIEEDILLNDDDFPGVKVGDILEISQTDVEHEDEKPRLLLMIGPNSIVGDKQQQLAKPLNRETIYIEKSIAETFLLQNLKDVFVRQIHSSQVNLDTVELTFRDQIHSSQVNLDTVELTFRDQYLGRCEMWRVTKKLIGSCICLNKKVEISQGTVRCQVYEMWGQGERIACGVVTSETKIVFRSTSAMIYLFIQMSSEMWQFDNFGNLYFENSIEGFLGEMFAKWKQYGSSHEVTIVLFSRCFYEAEDREQFPTRMRDCLQLGFDGKFYEDFYSVVVQNERFNDWSPVLLQLRKIFTDYQNTILDYHKTGNAEEDLDIPKGFISTAAQGNFLEVLNMSLNTFENHYLNRKLDRTGQQCLVITPGVGLFEVDRELMLVTKQRVLDSGVGSDLICVGEQPLHAVPLFKLYNQGLSENQCGDSVYCMPHWINLSFYSKPQRNRGGRSTFVPRIRLPPQVEALVPGDTDTFTENYFPRSEEILLPESDILKNPMSPYDDFDSKVFAAPKIRRRCRTILRSTSKPDEKSLSILSNQKSKRKISAPVIKYADAEFCYNLSMIEERETEEHQDETCLMESMDKSFDHQAIKKFLLRPGRALVNPFDTSLTEIRMTSNRRRWTHIFPKSWMEKLDARSNLSGVVEDAEIENGPSNVGVDWKSLTIPASLPLTTDYFPSDTSLVNDYLVNEYDLMPEEIWNDCHNSPLEKSVLSNEEVFVELISQRLAQGFQIIVFPEVDSASPRLFQNESSTSSLTNSPHSMWLSIGRIFHRLTLSYDKKRIKVTCYRPRSPYPSIAFHYRYRFDAPDTKNYDVSWVEFKTEQHENFNWNRMDFYVCTRGDKEFVLTESVKYWRFRLYVLPINKFMQDTKKIFEGDVKHGNIYSVGYKKSEAAELTDGFLKFLEICMNRMKRMSIRTPDERFKAYSCNVRNQQLMASHPRVNKLKSSLGLSSTSLGQMMTVFTPLMTESTPDCSSSSFDSNFGPQTSEVGTCGQTSAEIHSLSTTSTLGEILDAMKSSSHNGGVTFFNKIPGLPPLTFIADEAIKWVKDNLEDISDEDSATQVLQGMIKKKYICHASGNQDFPFLNGHHLYFIIQCGENAEWSIYEGDLESFQNDWVEIAMEKPSLLKVSDCPKFLEPSLDHFLQREALRQKMSEKFFKFVTFDIDHNSKSERKEWGHLKYQRSYDPCSTFELTMQWTVATGSIIAELIHGWARKSQQCGFSLIPIPHDPFALPITKNSDPVRGPIFVRLDTECLMESRSYLFEDFHESSWEQRLLLFREEIALSFGFISCITDRTSARFTSPSSAQFSTDHQYIHCTGNMFLLIPTQTLHQHPKVQGQRRKTSTAIQFLSVSYDEQTILDLKHTPVDHTLSQVNRHLSEQKPVCQYSETGFIWSWNFMISKGWRQTANAGATGDIPFMDKMLADFQAFCNNDQNRLKNFWHRCWSKRQET